MVVVPYGVKSFFLCHLPNPATFFSQLLKLYEILVMGLIPLLKRRKLGVRLVVTSHGTFFKCIQNEARGVLIPAQFICRKFLT